MEVADEVEERMSKLLGKKIPTLKQMAKDDFLKMVPSSKL